MLTMNRACTLVIVSVLLLAVFPVLPVKAQSKNISVPENYATVEGAIDAASNGDTIHFKAGTYDGPTDETLTINKAITLVGEGAPVTTLNLHPAHVQGELFGQPWPGIADAIKIESNNVKIIDLTLATPSSISISGINIELSNNIITSYLYGKSDGIKIIDNTISGSINVDGSNQVIVQNIINGDLLVNGNHNTIVSNLISGNGEQTVDIKADSNFIFNNTITNHAFRGINIEYQVKNNIIAKNNLMNSSGITIETSSSNNIIYGNTIPGLSLMGPNNTFYANEFYYLGVEGRHGDIYNAPYEAADNTFYHNNFMESSPELRTGKYPSPLFFNLDNQGNYWKNYHGTDANNDGIGDSYYSVTGTYSSYDGKNYENLITDCGRDFFPLMKPFDTASVNVDVPGWVPIIISIDSIQSSSTTESQNLPLTVILVCILVGTLIAGTAVIIYLVKHTPSKTSSQPKNTEPPEKKDT
jgi:nitrous oxidase accessory protein